MAADIILTPASAEGGQIEQLKKEVQGVPGTTDQPVLSFYGFDTELFDVDVYVEDASGNSSPAATTRGLGLVGSSVAPPAGPGNPAPAPGTGLVSAIYEVGTSGAQTIRQPNATWFGDVGIVASGGKNIPLSFDSGYTFGAGQLNIDAAVGAGPGDAITYTYASGVVGGEKLYAANEVVAGSPAGNALVQFQWLFSQLGSGTTPAPGVPVFNPATANWRYNAGIARTYGGVTYPAGLAGLPFSTTGPSFILRMATNYAAGSGLGNFSVLAGTQVLGSYVLTSGPGATQDFAITLPAGADATKLAVITGNAQRSYEAGDVQGVTVLAVTAASGYTIVPGSVAKANRVVGFDWDSIGEGYGASQPTLYGVTALLRKAGQDTVAFNYGSARLSFQFSQANLDAKLAQLHAAFDGVADPRYLIPIGTNDWGDDVCSPATLEAILIDFLIDVHRQFPTLKVGLVTALARAGETTAKPTAGTLEDMRQAVRNAGAATNTKVLEGAGLITPGPDGTHPDDARYAALRAPLQNFIDGLTVPFGSTSSAPLEMNGVNQYAVLTDSSASLSNLAGWSFGIRVKFISLPNNALRYICGRNISGTGNQLTQATYVAVGSLYGDWGSTGNGNQSGTPGFTPVAGVEYFIGGSYGNGTPFMVIGEVGGAMNVCPLQGTFSGLMKDSTEPFRIGAVADAGLPNNGIGNYSQATFKNSTLYGRATTQTEMLFLAGTSGGKECGALPATGTLGYQDAACLAYGTLERVGNATSLPNLANANRPFQLIGF